MKKNAGYIVAIIVAVMVAMIILPAAGEAEEFLHTAFVGHIEGGVVSFVDANGICFEWELESEDEEYELLDLVVFPLYGEKITKSHMGKPEYSGIRVDKDWAIRVLILNHPHFVDDIFNTGV